METQKTTQSATDSVPTATAEIRLEKKRAGGRAASGLAIILSLIALIGSGYVWYRVLYEKQALLNTDVLGQLARLEADDKAQRESATQSGERIKVLGDTQETLKTALEQLRNDLGRSRVDWALAETEQLLLIASRRLQLARDVSSALAALRAADHQLELLASPKLLPVRREIAREIGQIEALEKTDVDGVSLQLSTLAESINQLPLAQDVVRQPPTVALTEKTETQSMTDWQRIWRDLASLVRIREDARPQKPLLPPDQVFFLRENLRLALYSAQLALLQGNTVVYQQNLATANGWVKEFFDSQAPSVEATAKQLAALQQLKGITELPDISGSLTALRKVMGQKNPS